MEKIFFDYVISGAVGWVIGSLLNFVIKKIKSSWLKFKKFIIRNPPPICYNCKCDLTLRRYFIDNHSICDKCCAIYNTINSDDSINIENLTINNKYEIKS